MKTAIFISYRRSDTGAFTGRLDDHLRARFGNDQIYRDIDSIPLGVDFVAHLSEEIQKCDVFLVVIGNEWDAQRLDDENDFVRTEIEAALQRDILIIPVLVDGAEMPQRAELPAQLHPLLNRNAKQMSSGSDFKNQLEDLLSELQARLELEGHVQTSMAKTAVSTKSMARMGIVILAVLAVSLGFYIYDSQTVDPRPSPIEEIQYWLKLGALVCEDSEGRMTSKGIDEPYIIVNGEVVWGPHDMRCPSTRELDVEPILLSSERIKIELMESDATEVHNLNDDALGVFEGSTKTLGSNRQAFLESNAQYHLDWKIYGEQKH